MKLLLRHCSECKRHRSTRAAVVRSKRKRHRGLVRHRLRTGNYEDLVGRLYIGYTDWPLYVSVKP